MNGGSEKIEFRNHRGHLLSGRLEMPRGALRGWAIFAHCFTCSKLSLAATRISRRLSDHGIGVLRFDFTGLGESEGEFRNTSFSTNAEDLLAAAEALRMRGASPSVLIGHSLGGAAVLSVAARIPECQVVAVIGTPSDPRHVETVMQFQSVDSHGSVQAAISGRPFELDRGFFEDLQTHSLKERTEALDPALLVFHSPDDEIVDVSNGREIFSWARGPKSFLSLDGADHMLTVKEDADFVVGSILNWVERHLPAQHRASIARLPVTPGQVLIVSRDESLTHDVYMERHQLVSDEPVNLGGNDQGPAPYELLLAALGSCTALTLRIYARRKSWPLKSVSVRLTHRKVEASERPDGTTVTGKIDRIEKIIDVSGDLSEEQTARLMEIAEKCPVNRTLKSEIWIVSSRMS